jgi:CheY-like chemotaxis protein
MSTPKPLVPWTVLLVDDDVEQLELRARAVEGCGFPVVTAPGPMEAISIMAEMTKRIELAILDYHMPMMNGCALADQLKLMYPYVKIILHSGALDIPADQMTGIDVLIPKGDGVGALIGQVVEFALLEDGHPGILAPRSASFKVASC